MYTYTYTRIYMQNAVVHYIVRIPMRIESVYTKCIVVLIVRIVRAKPPINIKYDIRKYIHVNDGGGELWIFNVFILKSRRGFFLTVEHHHRRRRRPGLTVLRINVFDLLFSFVP